MYLQGLSRIFPAIFNVFKEPVSQLDNQTREIVCDSHLQ